jgi:hypothetical protein
MVAVNDGSSTVAQPLINHLRSRLQILPLAMRERERAKLKVAVNGGSSKVVETLTHNVKIYGSNTTTAIGRETEQK